MVSTGHSLVTITKAFLSLLLLLQPTTSLPQAGGGYSGVQQSGALDAGSLDTIQEIFGGNQQGQGYGADNIDVLVQVVQDRPNDFTTNGALHDQATVEVNDQFENCADYTERYGYECVPYYQCHNGTIITDGAGLIDIRNGFGTLTPEDSKCPGFLDVCCKDPDFIAPPEPVKKHVPQCGRRNNFGLGARISGFTESESQFGEWPHMCAVLHEQVVEQPAGYTGEQETVNLYQCGGSLIAPGALLTAAHCVDKFRQTPGSVKVRCGEWDTQTQNEPYAHQDRFASAIEVHPEFQAKNLQNDFAVIFLTEDFILAPHIDTICLPQAGEIFDGQTCFATGWGKDLFGSNGQYQVVLKEIDLPVVNHASCQEKLRTTRLGSRFKLHDSFTCAGGINGKDTCKGDGGSPLVCPSKYNPTTYVQAGIVAWGIGCGEDGAPGVYASVSQAVCWIDSVMTCRYGAASGDYNSYFGYTDNVCGTWLNGKLTELEQQRVAAGKFGRIFEALKQQYQQCTVYWGAPQAPLNTEPVDISVFERNKEVVSLNKDQATSAKQTIPGPVY